MQWWYVSTFRANIDDENSRQNAEACSEGMIKADVNVVFLYPILLTRRVPNKLLTIINSAKKSQL